MRRSILLLALLVSACSDPTPVRSAIKYDCRWAGDFATCVVGSDEETNCQLITLDDTGHPTRHREIPRPKDGSCRFDGSIAQ